jgi:hypothetical protein
LTDAPGGEVDAGERVVGVVALGSNVTASGWKRGVQRLLRQTRPAEVPVGPWLAQTAWHHSAFSRAAAAAWVSPDGTGI